MNAHQILSCDAKVYIYSVELNENYTFLVQSSTCTIQTCGLVDAFFPQKHLHLDMHHISYLFALTLPVTIYSNKLTSTYLSAHLIIEILRKVI